MRGALWTIGAYGASVCMRFGTNVILTRLVAPEVFGVMLIINTLRNGIELLSDVGVGQNIVQSRNGENRSFRDMAWTIQLIRGGMLFSILFAAATPLGLLYQLPASAVQLSALSLALMGAASVSIYLLQRRLQIIRLNLFDLGVDAVSAVLVLGFALYSPTIWSLIAANLVAMIVRTAATYLLPESAVRLTWNKEYAWQIVSFGKWIYLSSLLQFLCASFDKLYLGQAISLGLLGIYGLARNVADLPAALFARLGHSLIFPLIASHQTAPRSELRSHLAPLRLKLMLMCAASIAVGVAFADFAISVIYDSRYHDAAWMLPVMLLGVWASILCSMNEYALLGVGKPAYGAFGNMTKITLLASGIPLALHFTGIAGTIVIVALSDYGRYVPILVGQSREHISFFRQDVAATGLMIALISIFVLVRWELGWGTPFDGMFLP